MVLAEPRTAAGLARLFEQHVPLPPWNWLWFERVPSAEDVGCHVDVVIAAGIADREMLSGADRLAASLGCPTWLFACPDPEAESHGADSAADQDPLPTPALWQARVEAPAGRVERIALLVTSGRAGQKILLSPAGMAALATALIGSFQVTLLTREPDLYAHFAVKSGLVARCLPFAAGWGEALVQTDLVVTGDIDSALESASMLKPTILIEESTQASAIAASIPWVWQVASADVRAFIDRLDVDLLLPDMLNWKRAQAARYERRLSALVRTLAQ